MCDSSQLPPDRLVLSITSVVVQLELLDIRQQLRPSYLVTGLARKALCLLFQEYLCLLVPVLCALCITICSFQQYMRMMQ